MTVCRRETPTFASHSCSNKLIMDLLDIHCERQAESWIFVGMFKDSLLKTSAGLQEADARSHFGSWLQFWPKCSNAATEKVEKWLFSQIEAAGCVDWRPLSKWMDFQLSFFRRKLVVGITQHLSAGGVLGLAGKLHIRCARSSNFQPFHENSHHCVGWK